MKDTVLVRLIKEKAEQAGSARKAAQEIGIAHTSLGRILEGEPYSKRTAEKLARWLGVPLSTLLTAEDQYNSIETMASQIVLLLSQEPEIARVLKEGLERVADGRMRPDTFRELLRFASASFHIPSTEHEDVFDDIAAISDPRPARPDDEHRLIHRD